VPGAKAELAEPTAGSSSAPVATEEQYCDSICPSIANSNGQLLNLSGQPGWTTADDQWCANHNSQTNPQIMASPAPLGATVPTQSCATSYYPGDTSCAQVTAGFNRCQYKNSQVESYCQAYESAKMAGAGEDMVFLLDVAAAGTCGAVCVMEMTSIGAGQTVQKVCDGAAMGAGAAEILVTLTQQASTMGKIADAALGAAGIVEGIVGWKAASNNAGCASNGNPKSASGASGAGTGSGSLTQQVNSLDPAPTLNTTPMQGIAPPNLGAPTAPVINVQPALPAGITAPGSKNEYKAPTRLPSVDEFVASLFISNAEAAPQKGCEKQACITAVTMAALAGIRKYNMGYGERTKQKSCASIWALQSSANAVAGGITAAGFTATGGSTAGTSGSSIGSTGSSTGTTTAAGVNCVANGGTVASCSNGQVSAATDGGILGNSGLGAVAAPLAQQLASALPASSGDSGGPGGAMGAATSGDGAMGPALTKVAQTAFDNAKELGQVASMGYSSGGGGGATASDSNGLANLFGNSGAAAPAAAPMAVFRGDGEEGNDIWHSHTSNNIFQIISHRIGKVNP
jgi:hypothetical protein